MPDTIRTETDLLSRLNSKTGSQFVIWGATLFSLQDFRDLVVTMFANDPDAVVVNDTMSASEILGYMQAGGHVHFKAGTYDLSSIESNTVLNTTPLRITGDGRDLVTIDIGGTAQTLTEQFRIQSSLYCYGVKFTDGRAVFSVQGFGGTIPEIVIRDCAFDQVGAALLAELPTNTLQIDWIDVSYNVFTDCNSGVHMRMAVGPGPANMALVYRGRFNNNRMSGLDKYGIVVAYDNPQVPYTLEGYAECVGNDITNVVGQDSAATGFGINLSAYKEVLIQRCNLEDFVSGTRVALEPVYSKSIRCRVLDCRFKDCHDVEGGGGVANKGHDSGQIVELFEVARCTFISTALLFRYAIWIEGHNTWIHDCDFYGAFRSCIGVLASNDGMYNMRIENNRAQIDHIGGSESGIAYTSQQFLTINVDFPSGLVFQGNYIEAMDLELTGGSYRAVLLDIDSGESCDNAVIRDNVFVKGAAMTGALQAIRLDRGGTGSLESTQILNNHLLILGTPNSDRLADIIGSALDGTTRIHNNSEVGCPSPINNATSSTLEEKDNSWNQLYSSTTVAADVLAIPVTHRYVAKTTGVDAEALTLANGKPGQLLTISLVSDGGGDGTLTPTTKTGFSTIVFADVKDTVTLEFVDNTLGWMILGYYGTAAPPVIT